MCQKSITMISAIATNDIHRLEHLLRQMRPAPDALIQAIRVG